MISKKLLMILMKMKMKLILIIKMKIQKDYMREKLGNLSCLRRKAILRKKLDNKVFLVKVSKKYLSIIQTPKLQILLINKRLLSLCRQYTIHRNMRKMNL